MTLVNSLTRPILVIDVKVAGVSVMAAVRAAAIKNGWLQDPDDDGDLVFLPGEQLTVELANHPGALLYEMRWIEP